MTEEKDILSFEELVKLITSQAQIALDHPYVFKRPIKNVAVIGAGPHGLCSARHLKETGMNVKVFERNGYIGGLWKYSDTAPPKPKIPTSRVTLDESSLKEVPTDGSKYQRTFEITPELTFALLKKCPPSACYRDLITNIPSTVFAFPDFPMPKEMPVFPKHQDMLAYFESYAEAFGLLPLIELNTSVDRVMKIGDEWELVLSKYDIYPSGFVRETRWRERFDAVVAASGLHQDPYVPDIKDLAAYNKMWPTKVAHSKQFRRPEDFKDKNVLIVGVGISGVDIARSLDGFAKSIVMAYKDSFTSPFMVINIIRSKIPKDTVIKPEVVSFSNANGQVDGTITFQDGTFIKDVDQIFFCTGYKNSLGYLDGLIIRENEYQSTSQPPFADVPKSKVVLGREYALNTYHEVFLMSDPTLCFIAMARIFSLTPYYDTQAIAIARVWSGNAYVPETRWMCQLEAEFKPGLPSKINMCDIRRREVYVSWLNYQANKMGKSDLPQVKNFDDDYEQEGESRPQIWCDFTDAHLQKTKERIRKELESLLP